MDSWASQCPACHGLACKGGGNVRCIKRNPRASHLYGILDTYGGIRFVITHKSNLKHHVRPDELAIMVPDLIVHEPIAWDDIPVVIRRIELVVDDWIENNRPNEPHAREAISMYQLRKLEHPNVKGSLNLGAIVET